MTINFATLKGLTIPDGNVVKIVRDNVTIWEKITSRIPSEYQEVEWIKAGSNVGTYIDLGFAFDTKCKIYLSQYITEKGVVAYPFGAAENSGRLRCMLSMPYSGGRYGTFYGTSPDGYIGTAYLPFSVNVWNEFELILEPNKPIKSTNLTENITDQTNKNLTTYTMTNNLYLFAQNYNGTKRANGIRQISYFKYYDKNDELICDLVPCYRKSDGEIGMYDLARKMFLTQPSGEINYFEKGPDVN